MDKIKKGNSRWSIKRTERTIEGMTLNELRPSANGKNGGVWVDPFPTNWEEREKMEHDLDQGKDLSPRGSRTMAGNAKET